jgi:hypothetical protein
MATKHTDKCLEKAADDEPIFVLRAQDKLAANTVRHWAREFLKAHGGVLSEQIDPKVIAKYKEAHALADKMDAWKTKKTPD